MPQVLLPLLACLILSPTCDGLIRVLGIDCVAVDPNFLSFETCILKPVSRGVKELKTKVNLLKIPVTNVSVHFELRRRGATNQLVYSFDIDGCRFMESKRRNPIANAVYKTLSLATVSNINHTCPYDHDLIIDHFRVDEKFNMYLPVTIGDYYFKLFWSNYNVLRAIVIATLQII